MIEAQLLRAQKGTADMQRQEPFEFFRAPGQDGIAEGGQVGDVGVIGLLPAQHEEDQGNRMGPGRAARGCVQQQGEGPDLGLLWTRPLMQLQARKLFQYGVNTLLQRVDQAGAVIAEAGNLVKAQGFAQEEALGEGLLDNDQLERVVGHMEEPYQKYGNCPQNRRGPGSAGRMASEVPAWGRIGSLPARKAATLRRSPFSHSVAPGAVNTASMSAW